MRSRFTAGRVSAHHVLRVIYTLMRGQAHPVQVTWDQPLLAHHHMRASRSTTAAEIRDPHPRPPRRDDASRVPNARGGKTRKLHGAHRRACRPGGAAWSPRRDRGARARATRGASPAAGVATPFEFTLAG